MSTIDPYALTSLAAVKSYMGITSSADDNALIDLINAVTAMIERACCRKFKARDCRKRIDLSGQRRIVLDSAPVQYVSRVASGRDVALRLQFVGSAIRADAAVYRDPESADAGGVRLTSVDAAGVTTSTLITATAAASTSALATMIAAVSGWTVTAAVNVPTADLNPVGGDGRAGVNLTYPGQDGFGFSVDFERGIIELNEGWGAWLPPAAADDPDFPLSSRCGFQGLLVAYRGGFETIPADVAQLCNELVKETYMSRGQNTAAASTTLGPYSVTWAQNQQDRIQQRLSRYVDLAGQIGVG